MEILSCNDKILKRRLAGSLVLASVALAGAACGSSPNSTTRSRAPESTTTAAVAPTPSVTATTVELVPGCVPYAVYSQNRFQPFGTAVRTQPSVLAPKAVDIHFSVNEVIPVDAWSHTGVISYPTNSPELRDDVWLHVARTNGWVSFDGVRGAPTSPDPTGSSPDLGTLAELRPGCQYSP